MRYFFLPIALLSLFLISCGNAGTGASSMLSSSDANIFNPWLQDKLPNTRNVNSEGQQMLNALGAQKQSIEGEAAFRKNWREEIYPVVFGQPKAVGEILVLLDFSSPDSEKVWNAVVEASRQLSPEKCKIAVFGRSRENYCKDLMGLAIWIAHSRRGQAMNYLSYALKRWNFVKNEQRKAGRVKDFTNEYDATATPKDFPIHYSYLAQLKPPVPAGQELAVAKYCYDAGNVNMYQANQICQYYGIKTLPSVIVNGKVIADPTAQTITQALQ